MADRYDLRAGLEVFEGKMSEIKETGWISTATELPTTFKTYLWQMDSSNFVFGQYTDGYVFFGEDESAPISHFAAWRVITPYRPFPSPPDQYVDEGENFGA
jgi:hypothetical protein